jgi:accessory colonization factor AcfC
LDRRAGSSRGEAATRIGDLSAATLAERLIDAWLIWNVWQVANPGLAKGVPFEEPFRFCRDTAVVPTRQGGARPGARAIVE